MEKQFVPYELAVKLKELGFDEECISFYNQSGSLNLSRIDSFNWVIRNSNSQVVKLKCVSAPLWQQAFDWFREKHGWDYLIQHRGLISREYNLMQAGDYSKTIVSEKSYKTYEQACQACLEKLIELITIKD